MDVPWRGGGARKCYVIYFLVLMIGIFLFFSFNFFQKPKGGSADAWYPFWQLP
jgi:hypothetical protein